MSSLSTGKSYKVNGQTYWVAKTGADIATAIFTYKIPSQNICTSFVKNFDYTFRSYTTFNGSIDNWDTANGTSMNRMFERASAFNQDIRSWSTYVKARFQTSSSSPGWLDENKTYHMYYNSGLAHANAPRYYSQVPISGKWYSYWTPVYCADLGGPASSQCPTPKSWIDATTNSRPMNSIQDMLKYY